MASHLEWLDVCTDEHKEVNTKILFPMSPWARRIVTKWTSMYCRVQMDSTKRIEVKNGELSQKKK